MILYKSRISILNIIISSLDLLCLIISGSFLIYKGKFESIWASSFGILLLLIGFYQFTSYIKIFYLSKDELTIRFPFKFFNSNSNYKLTEITQVNFKKGFKSPFVTIQKINSNYEDTFAINFYNSDIEKFIIALNKLGIKTTRKNI